MENLIRCLEAIINMSIFHTNRTFSHLRIYASRYCIHFIHFLLLSLAVFILFQRRLIMISHPHALNTKTKHKKQLLPHRRQATCVSVYGNWQLVTVYY